MFSWFYLTTIKKLEGTIVITKFGTHVIDVFIYSFRKKTCTFEKYIPPWN